MSSLDVLKDELTKLYSEIEGIKIRYELKNDLLTHIVEIKPIDIYSNNDDYLNKEIEIEEKFAEMFPSEEVVFISEESLSTISKPCFQLGYIDDVLLDLFNDIDYNSITPKIKNNNLNMPYSNSNGSWGSFLWEDKTGTQISVIEKSNPQDNNYAIAA